MIVAGELFAPGARGPSLIRIEDGRLGAVEPWPPGAPLPDGAVGGRETRIAPGFVDLQLNGGWGEDFSDPGANVATVARALPSTGVTAFLATVVTSPLECYGPCLGNLAAATAREGAREAEGAARCLGVHIEGPFLNPTRAGTHAIDRLQQPSTELALDWLERAPVRVVTLAPELPGCLEVIGELSRRGVTVAIGHTDATWTEAAAAAGAGARLGTHLFNAMRPLHHRDPGVAGFLLASELAVSVVADGVHLAPETLRLVARTVGPERLVIISDATAGLGRPPGRFALAGVEAISDGTTIRRRDGTLSGSVAGLDHGLRTCIVAGIGPADAIRALTANPARVIGVEAEHGMVAVGRRADLVLLDDEWRVAATMIAGRWAYGGPTT